jgi:hypothetical protein
MYLQAGARRAGACSAGGAALGWQTQVDAGGSSELTIRRGGVGGSSELTYPYWAFCYGRIGSPGGVSKKAKAVREDLSAKW